MDARPRAAGEAGRPSSCTACMHPGPTHSPAASSLRTPPHMACTRPHGMPTSSEAGASFSFLTATSAPVCLSRHFQTDPYAPSPTRWRNSYFCVRPARQHEGPHVGTARRPPGASRLLQHEARLTVPSLPVLPPQVPAAARGRASKGTRAAPPTHALTARTRTLPTQGRSIQKRSPSRHSRTQLAWPGGPQLLQATA